MIVDDHPVFRSGLKTILSNELDFRIISEATNGEEAIERVKKVHPEIIIMDISMPGIDGIEATKAIKSFDNSIKILILTMYNDEAYLKEGLQVGADGYVLKRAVDTELISAIRVVLDGEKYIYPTLIPSLYKTDNILLDGTNSTNDPHEVPLSKREKEVLTFIALGYTQKEIAEELFISIKTVETYRARIVDKIGKTKRSDLVKYAIRNNLVNF